jgi:hypothetical protein
MNPPVSTAPTVAAAQLVRKCLALRRGICRAGLVTRGEDPLSARSGSSSPR